MAGLRFWGSLVVLGAVLSGVAGSYSAIKLSARNAKPNAFEPEGVTVPPAALASKVTLSAAGSGSKLQSGPVHVPYHLPTVVPVTGTLGPTADTWELSYGSTPSVTSSDPRGWTVTYSGSQAAFTIIAPYGFPAGVYTLKYFVNGVGNKSADFDLRAIGSPGGFLDFWSDNDYHGNPPYPPQTWDVLKGTTVVASGSVPNGWSWTPVGGYPYGGTPQIALVPPASAPVGTDYVFRSKDPVNAAVGFDLVGGAFSVPTSITADPPLGFLIDAMTPPDWMAATAPSDEPESPGGDSATGSGGPASALSVDLVHGVLTADSGPDLVISNRIGPEISFERIYRTALAAGNLSSPGMAPGWNHNWDYRIVAVGSGRPLSVPPDGRAGPRALKASSPPSTTFDDWNGMQLVYPGGASELLTPVLSGGSPTGAFTVAPGTPFWVTGVPNITEKVWTSITINHNGLAKEVFTQPAGNSVMRLQSVTYPNGQQITFNYASSGKLLNIQNGGAQNLLTLGYGGPGGLMSTATDPSTTRARTYGYASGELSTVSAISTPSTAEWNFGYTTIGGHPYLNTTQTKDPQGTLRTATVAYELGTGRARSITDAKGNVRDYDYLPSGGATVQSLGAETVTCDAAGRTSGVINGSGDITGFAYGSADNPSIVTATTLPNGQSYTTSVDNKGNPTTVHSPYGYHTDVVWDYTKPYAPLGIVTSSTEYGRSGGSRQTQYTYYDTGLKGYLQTVTYPNNAAYTYTYTSLGNLSTVTGPSTAMAYGYTVDKNGATVPERFGTPLSIQDGTKTDGTNFDTTWLTYNTAWQVSSVTDPKGITTSCTYNSYDQPATYTLPLTPTITIAHTVPGKSATGATVGSTTLFGGAYDAESALNVATDGNAHTNTTNLNTVYGLSSVLNGNQKQMHAFDPSPLNRSSKTTLGTGAKSLNVTSYLNALGNLNYVQSVEDNWSLLVTPFLADPDVPAHLAFTLNPASGPFGNGDATYDYDEFGRVKSSQSKYQMFNPSTSDGYGISHAYTYDDNLDALVTDKITTDVGLYGNINRTISYAYNPDGSRQSMSVPIKAADGTSANKASVVFTYAYDTTGRITRATAQYADANFGNLESPPVADARYRYDANGQITEVRTTKGDTFYTYDALGRLTSLMNVTRDGFADPYATQYQVNDPDTVSHNGLVHSILSSFSNFTYDALGNRTGYNFVAQKTIGTSTSVPSTFASGSVGFTYDTGGRLTTETWTCASLGSQVTQVHTYDAADNLSSLRGAACTIDQDVDQMTGSAVPGYSTVSYNKTGQETLANGLSYFYNPQGSVILVQGTTVDTALGSHCSLDQRVSYDANGLRGYQQFTFSNNTSANHQETYYYDGSALLYRWAGNWGSSQGQNYANGVTDLGDASVPDPFVIYLWGPTGPVMEFDAGQVSHAKMLCFDPQGNCVNTTCDQYLPFEDSLVKNPMFYDGYGEPVWPDPPSDNQRAMRQPLQYKGQAGYYTDVHTDLCYCINRYYDPRSGRWTMRDPAGLEGGVNVYEYCSCNPVMMADPSGLQGRDWTRDFINDQLGIRNNGDATDVYKAADRAMMKWPWLPGDYYRFMHHTVTGDGGYWALIGDVWDGFCDFGLLIDGMDFLGGFGFGAEAGNAARASGPIYRNGEFSVWDWSGYPKGKPRPTMPLQNLKGPAYENARRAANNANKRIRTALKLPSNVQVHEIHPVRFGGHPTSLFNKIWLPKTEHDVYSAFWMRILRGLGK